MLLRIKVRMCLLGFVVCLLGFASPVVGQQPGSGYLPGNIKYAPEIPTPSAFFGFRVGEYHLRHDQIVAYMKRLGEVSERISVEEYAQTYEGRPLLMLTITSPENHENLEKIRQAHLVLSDPARSDSMKIDEMPAVVWMGYSIHGNEASGSNAATLVAYYLAAAQSDEVKRVLERTVVLLDPCQNPDGLARFAQWANGHRGEHLNADPNHREHQELWPGGRTNHYWFDLNRDWLPVQHPESRGRIRLFHRWKPNVLTDHHEMGTDRTFFFQPGVPSRNNPLTPESVYRLTAEMASFHARALDEIGSLYYTREGYDDFYAGKGSTYPDLNGGVGILFEQASVRGHRQESENGTLTFPFAIRNQVVSSLSTLRAALELRSRLLAHQRMFFKSALVEADRTPVRAYVFSAPGDPVRAYHFLDLLHQHGIKAYALSRQVRIGEQDFLPGESYLVPTQQPQYRLITSIFETQTSFTDSLFYDVSTWTLPPAFHLSFAAYRSKTLPAELLGQRADRPVFPQGTVRGAANAYAYVFSWDAYYAPRALYRLLKSGVQAKVATHPFEARIDSGGQRFGYGTVMIPAGGKDGLLRARMDSVARLDGVQVFALETGLSMRGIDVGSPSFEPVVRPRVMVAVGEGVSASEAGESWYVLDRRFDMDVSLVETGRFRSVVLNRYTCVVLPSGSYRTVDSTGVAALARWVEDGGTLILQGEAVEWGLKRKLANGKLKSLQTPVKDERRAYADATRDLGAQKIGGVILEVQIDPSHPMGYGYAESRVAVFRQGTVFLEPSENPYATPLQYTDFPLVSGYLSANNEALLRNSAAVMVSGRGRGRVILMPDSPMFRSFWYGTDKLLLNGIFFGRMIQPETTERVKVGSR